MFRSRHKRALFNPLLASLSPIMPPPLPPDRFLTELHKMFEAAKAGGSVSLTTKRSEWGLVWSTEGRTHTRTHTRARFCYAAMHGGQQGGGEARRGPSPRAIVRSFFFFFFSPIDTPSSSHPVHPANLKPRNTRKPDPVSCGSVCVCACVCVCVCERVLIFVSCVCVCPQPTLTSLPTPTHITVRRLRLPRARRRLQAQDRHLGGSEGRAPLCGVLWHNLKSARGRSEEEGQS